MAVRRRRGLSFDILGQDKTGRAFSQVNRRLKTLGAGALRAGKALAAVGAAAAAGLAVVTKKAIDAADKIAKVADSTGFTTDALQELRFAAQLSGVEMVALDGATTAFGKRVGELRADTGTLVEILKKLDPALLENLKAAEGVDEAFDLVVKRMARMENQTDRAALSAAAFGRQAGVAMTNLVRDGVDALDEMRQKAQDLGLVMEEDLLRNAEGAQDALTILTSVIKTRLTVAIIKAAPTIERFALGLVKVIEKIDQFFKAPEEARLSAEIAAVEADLEDLNKTAARVALGLQEPIMGLDTLIGRTEGRLGDLREELARLRGEIEKTAPALPGLGLPQAGGARPPVPDRKPIEEITKAIKAETAALKDEADTISAKIGETDKLVDVEGELKDVTTDLADNAIRGQIASWQELGNVATSVLQRILSKIIELGIELAASGLAGAFGGGGGISDKAPGEQHPGVGDTAGLAAPSSSLLGRAPRAAASVVEIHNHGGEPVEVAPTPRGTRVDIGRAVGGASAEELRRNPNGPFGKALQDFIGVPGPAPIAR